MSTTGTPASLFGGGEIPAGMRQGAGAGRARHHSPSGALARREHGFTGWTADERHGPGSPLIFTNVCGDQTEALSAPSGLRTVAGGPRREGRHYTGRRTPRRMIDAPCCSDSNLIRGLNGRGVPPEAGISCSLVPKLCLGTHVGETPFRVRFLDRTRSRASRKAFPSGAWERGARRARGRNPIAYFGRHTAGVTASCLRRAGMLFAGMNGRAWRRANEEVPSRPRLRPPEQDDCAAPKDPF